jgi:hypothetical protein
MTTKSELDLQATRPTDRTIDNEFTPSRREAILNTVLDQHQVTAFRLRPGPRILVAAGIALLLAGVTVGAVTARQPDQDRPPAVAQPSAAQPSSTKPSTGPTDDSPPPAQQVVTLEQIADRAGRREGPVKIGPDEFRRIVTVSRQSDGPVITNESYIAADGWTWRKDTENGRVSWMLYRGVEGPLDPADLPTDPRELERELMKYHLGTDSDTRGLFKLIEEVVATELAPPMVRAAAIELLADLAERPVRTIPARKGGETTPDITVVQGSISERLAVGTRFTDKSVPNLRYTMWFDVKTSEIVRTDHVARNGSVFSSEVRSRTVVDSLPPEFLKKLGAERVEKYPGGR